MSFLKQSLDNIKVWINEIIENSRLSHEYSGYSITLDNETKLVVSRSRLKEVKEQMARYWRNRV